MGNIIAIIPARAGSKGIQDKNIIDLAGKPLIAYTIEAAKNSKYISDIIVSTDSSRIAKIAESIGARTPFMRPPYLAKDNSRRNDVIKHVLNWVKSEKLKYEHFVYLQPTSPLREGIDIDKAVDYRDNKNAKAVVSVTKAKHNPQIMNTLPENLNMANFFNKNAEDINRQELPSFYRINGAIYLSSIKYFFKEDGFIGKKTYAYIMTQERSIDIDSLFDLKIAKCILEQK